MTIYLDSLFSREMVMNLFLIFCTNKILCHKIVFGRLILSSIFGAIYTIICLICPMLINLRILVVFGIVYIGTGVKTLREYLISAFTYYLFSFFISGICYYTYDSKLKTLIYLIIGTFMIIYLIKMYIEKYKINSYICEIEIKICGKMYKIKGLIDTGNSLKSVSDEEVIIISPRIVKRFGNSNISSILLQGNLNQQNEYLKQIRIINYKALGNKSGMKYGIPIEEVKLKYEGKTLKRNVVIISADENFEGYDAILSLSIIKGGKENGNINAYKEKSKDFIWKVLNAYRN